MYILLISGYTYGCMYI